MRRFGRDDRGQAIVLVGITMLGMLFAVGLALDSGQLFVARRSAQEAADSAAFAGAVVLYQNGTVSQATSAATSDASLNGYATDTPTSGTTVTPSSPPASGSFSSDASCVMVAISTPVRTALVPQGSTFTTVVATGVACSVINNSQYAIMAIDQSCDAGTVSLSSQGSLIVHGGSIDVNSCNSQAAQSSGTITLDAGYYSDVVGNVTGTWPNLRSGRPVQADPFAGTAKPSTTGLTTYATPACSPTINQPGIYTGTANSNCEYLFAPGTYIWKGGGISLAGNSSACTGTSCGGGITPTATGGVFFFFTTSNYSATGGTCTGVALNGNNATTLSPPTTGTYQGMLMWIDSNCGSGTGMSVGGGGALTTTGSIYVPAGTVSGNGNNAVIKVSQIVAYKMDTQNADFTFNYSTSGTFQGHFPALVQ